MNSKQLINEIGGEGIGESSLISLLERIQSKYSYLPRKALEAVAEHTGRHLSEIYGVATFYRAFSLTPRGKHLVSVCLGTACHVQNGARLAEEFERRLKIKAGETTEDREFTLETVNCLGACALGPVVVVDGHYFSTVKTAQVPEILDESSKGLDNVDIETDQRIFPVEVSCSRCNHSLMDPRHPIDSHPSIRVTTSFGDHHGWTALSSLWGSYNVESEYEIPDDSIINVFCPHCHAELMGGGKCSECDAPMVPMIVRGGGVVQICARMGCKGHILDLGEAVVD